MNYLTTIEHTALDIYERNLAIFEKAQSEDKHELARHIQSSAMSEIDGLQTLLIRIAVKHDNDKADAKREQLRDIWTDILNW